MCRPSGNPLWTQGLLGTSSDWCTEVKMLQKLASEEEQVRSSFCFHSASFQHCLMHVVDSLWLFWGRFLDHLLFLLRGPSGTDSLSSRLLTSSFKSTSQSPSFCAHLMCPKGLLCWGKGAEPECPPHQLSVKT